MQVIIIITIIIVIILLSLLNQLSLQALLWQPNLLIMQVSQLRVACEESREILARERQKPGVAAQDELRRAYFEVHSITQHHIAPHSTPHSTTLHHVMQRSYNMSVW
jgi:hypothetical protein